VPDLDGVWNVERTGGLLPPLVGVRKAIAGTTGRTTLGPIAAGFDVVGRELRYRSPLSGFVDVLEPAAEGWSGRALFRGKEYGTFRLRRIEAAVE
jgi:hypothetical protein